MNKSMATVLISATLAVSLPAGAHTEEYFDSIDAPHGGQMRMAGPLSPGARRQGKEKLCST